MMTVDVNDIKLQYVIKSFDQLSIYELYGLLRIRQEVFVVEQNCPYQDLDDKDQKAHHIIAYHDDKIVAYTRLLAPGASYPDYSSIGRVVNDQEYRGKGIGKVIMKVSIEKTKELYPHHPIKISAQTYILDFYSSLGFVAIGEEYLEDDIPHRGMILEF